MRFRLQAIVLLMLASRLSGWSDAGRADDASWPPSVGDTPAGGSDSAARAAALDESLAAEGDGSEAAVGETGAAPRFLSETLWRAGWWLTDIQGSPTKIGEYQDLASSAFWDLDHLGSDGVRTLAFSATALDRESVDARMHHFSPRLTADLRCQQFPHRLDHDPLLNWPSLDAIPTVPPSGLAEGSELAAEDLDAGQDYAIRVQELKAGFKGQWSDGIRWRLNVWAMRKSGQRQVNSLSNCFDHPQVSGDVRACHLLSRGQQIDWLTTEIEPVAEGNWGPLTAKFSMPLRSFDQDDQTLARLYNSYPAIFQGRAMTPQLGSENFPAGSEYPYAVVPESFTHTRKLQLAVDLSGHTHLYGLLYHGMTENQDRNTRRTFDGVDLRLTDRTFENLTLTGFAKLHREQNQLPILLISGEQLEFDRFDETEIPCEADDRPDYGGCGCGPITSPCVVGEDGVPDFFASDALVPPIDYRRTTAGFNGRFSPFRGDGTWKEGWAFYGGYEYRGLNRGFADFEASVSAGERIVVSQPYTNSHLLHAATSQRWTRNFDTFLRCRSQYQDRPLFGVRETNGVTNSNLPVHSDLVELGGNWSPTDNFLFNVTAGIENRFHHSTIADFDEDNYPLTLSCWYAPTCELSFSAGYAYYSNWIDQAITLGDDLQDAAAYAPVTRRWSFGGRSHICSLGSTYAWSPCLRLQGNVQYVRGHNSLDSTVFEPPHVWPEIAELAQDLIETVRISGGFDRKLGQRTNGYFRYNYFDYDDVLNAHNRGTAHLFLAGVSGTY